MKITSKVETEILEYFEQKWSEFWGKYVKSFLHDINSMGKYSNEEIERNKNAWNKYWARIIEENPKCGITNIPPFEKPKEIDLGSTIKNMAREQILDRIRGRKKTDTFFYKYSVDEYIFVLKTLVLQVNKDKSAFQNTSIEKARRTYLKKGSTAYKKYMEFCRQLLGNRKLSIYSITNTYFQANPTINVSAKSLENSFRSFLKTHEKDIMEEFKLSKADFDKTFRKKISNPKC